MNMFITFCKKYRQYDKTKVYNTLNNQSEINFKQYFDYISSKALDIRYKNIVIYNTNPNSEISRIIIDYHTEYPNVKIEYKNKPPFYFAYGLLVNFGMYFLQINPFIIINFLNYQINQNISDILSFYNENEIKESYNVPLDDEDMFLFIMNFRNLVNTFRFLFNFKIIEKYPKSIVAKLLKYNVEFWDKIRSILIAFNPNGDIAHSKKYKPEKLTQRFFTSNMKFFKKNYSYIFNNTNIENIFKKNNQNKNIINILFPYNNQKILYDYSVVKNDLEIAEKYFDKHNLNKAYKLNIIITQILHKLFYNHVLFFSIAGKRLNSAHFAIKVIIKYWDILKHIPTCAKVFNSINMNNSNTEELKDQVLICLLFFHAEKNLNNGIIQILPKLKENLGSIISIDFNLLIKLFIVIYSYNEIKNLGQNFDEKVVQFVLKSLDIKNINIKELIEILTKTLDFLNNFK